MTISLSLLGGAGWQFFDNSGDVLSGGRLFTYAAGTTTPLTTYTSSTGLTANANPIILDSAGRVPYQIWLTDGSAYKFVLQNSVGEQIGAWDNVSTEGVTAISFGTTGLTPSTATQGSVTVAGTLNVANGGTGLSSLTAGRIPFGNGTAALDNSASLTYVTGTSTLSVPNLTFTGTGGRIKGDFSNATPANRTAFQDATTNNGTSIYALPNGTSNAADFTAFNNSTPTNAAYAGVGITLTEASVYTSVTGSGTQVPLALKVGISRVIIRTNGVFDFFNNSGTNIARLDASGNFAVIGNVTAYATL